MELWELFWIALGLSMDAFAVAVSKGLSVRDGRRSRLFGACALTGLYFGAFQALMPVIGYCVGARFERYVRQYDHWVAFVLLGLIGAGMLREAFDKDASGAGAEAHPFAVRGMLLLAVATSIDALAVGISFAFLEVRIAPAAALIGLTTFVCSFVGVRIGAIFGMRYKKYAEIAGGALLILMGIKILVEHLTGGA